MEFGFVVKFLTKVGAHMVCTLCKTPRTAALLSQLHQFSDAFVNGITGSALKCDALSTHMTTAAHLAGYVNTVIYSCLLLLKHFFIFFHSKRWESNESMKQTFSVVDVYSQKIQYTKMQF